jgi:hypothetical protein
MKREEEEKGMKERYHRRGTIKERLRKLPTSTRTKRQTGHSGEWSNDRQRQDWQKEWPQGVVTGR